MRLYESTDQVLTGTSCDPINRMGEMFITGSAMNVQFDLWKTLSNALLATFITYTDVSPMTCQYDANTVKSTRRRLSFIT
jgi:hypothetical protein